MVGGSLLFIQMEIIILRMRSRCLPMPPPHHAGGSGHHDGRIEERIRRIKDNARAIQAGLPYRLGKALWTWCIYYSTYVLNLIPQRTENTSPREIMTGIKPEFKRALPIGFGEFAQVLEQLLLLLFSPRERDRWSSHLCQQERLSYWKRSRWWNLCLLNFFLKWKRCKKKDAGYWGAVRTKQRE